MKVNAYSRLSTVGSAMISPVYSEARLLAVDRRYLYGSITSDEVPFVSFPD